MNLKQTIQVWKDEEETHRWLNDTFVGLVNATPELKAYRDWIEQNIFGFGERSFIWMWKLLVDEMPKDFTFLEVGVFRGQVLGIVQLCAQTSGKHTLINRGITPLDSTGGHWESDYAADIDRLFKTFNLLPPDIVVGLSTDKEIITKVQGKYDMVYIDGGHDEPVVQSDLIHYPPLVKVGGFLIIDDCCHKYKLPNGFFPGIESVSKAVDEVLPNEQFQELFSIVHNRVFKRVK